MSLGRVVKITIAALLIWMLLYIMATALLGPGIRDSSRPLLNGYIYNDAGHYEKTILRQIDRNNSKIIIDARVDGYKIDGDNIYIARRPREVHMEDRVVKSRLSSRCEYWQIDTVEHSAFQVSRVDDLSCK